MTHYGTTEQLNYLYNSVNCGIFPSRGEGFNLPALEMAKIGKSVITTTYSGHAEFSDKRLQCKVSGFCPLDNSIYDEGLFGEPDIENLKKLMRQVYENYEKELILAEEHSKTLSKFTWDNVGEKMDKILKEI